MELGLRTNGMLQEADKDSNYVIRGRNVKPTSNQTRETKKDGKRQDSISHGSNPRLSTAPTA